MKSQRTPAWLLDCGGGVRVAIALPNLLHLIEDRTLLQRVPLVPKHLGQVLLWQQRVFPVLDLALQMGVQGDTTAHHYVCLLGWCPTHQHSEYGGLLVRELPRRIQIADAALATPPPQLAAQWSGIALTYFDFHDHITPIIAPAALFEPAARTEESAISPLAQQRQELCGT